MRKRSSQAKPANQGTFLEDGPGGNPADETKPEPKEPKKGGRRPKESSSSEDKPETPKAPSLDAKAGAMASMGQDEPRRRSKDVNVDARLDPGYQRIVDTLFDLPDPAEVQARVKNGLRLRTKASAASYGTLVDALDQAEELAVEANQLLCNAKESRDSFEMDAAIVLGALKEQAMAVLMAEYRNKERRSPTNDDVNGYLVTHFADDYRDIETRRARARRMVEYLEGLLKASQERCRDLRQMVAGSRGA